MKIAIEFGDNDFHRTFLSLLETLNKAYQCNGELPRDKKKLCFIINQLSAISYLLFQNQYKYNGMEDVVDGLKTNENEEYSHIKEYLQITPDALFLDEEVDKCLKNNIWDNSETFLLDTEIYENGVKTGYIWSL